MVSKAQRPDNPQAGHTAATARPPALLRWKPGPFELVSDFRMTGDQPKAVDRLVDGIVQGADRQALMGVTGSGKTFTMANVVQRVQRPTLVMAHNKTLAAQLATEFKEFFPRNAVEFFVSYYDYYQPRGLRPPIRHLHREGRKHQR